MRNKYLYFFIHCLICFIYRLEQNQRLRWRGGWRGFSPPPPRNLGVLDKRFENIKEMNENYTNASPSRMKILTESLKIRNHAIFSYYLQEVINFLVKGLFLRQLKT